MYSRAAGERGENTKKITPFFFVTRTTTGGGGGVRRPICHKKITTSQNPFLAILSTFRDFFFKGGGVRGRTCSLQPGGLQFLACQKIFLMNNF